MPGRWRKVVESFKLPNPTGAGGGTRVEELECGHRWVGKQSAPRAQRRRCDSCPNDARNNPGPTTGIPKRRRLRAAERDALLEEMGQRILGLMDKARSYGCTERQVRTAAEEAAVNWTSSPKRRLDSSPSVRQDAPHDTPAEGAPSLQSPAKTCPRCRGTRVYCVDCGSAAADCVCAPGYEGERLECPCRPGGEIP